MAARDRRRLLRGLAPAAFLARHWHKESLLVRAAVADLAATLSRDALFDLAARDDVASRLVCRESNRYSLTHGPFARSRLRKLPASNWTLLVQGVNQHDDIELIGQADFVEQRDVVDHDARAGPGMCRFRPTMPSRSASRTRSCLPSSRHR